MNLIYNLMQSVTIFFFVFDVLQHCRLAHFLMSLFIYFIFFIIVFLLFFSGVLFADKSLKTCHFPVVSR